MYSIMGVKFSVGLVQRSQFFEILLLCTNMPSNTWKRLAQEKKVSIFFSCYNKCLFILDLFEGLQ